MATTGKDFILSLLSTDAKPTDVATGQRVMEIDTGDVYGFTAPATWAFLYHTGKNFNFKPLIGSWAVMPWTFTIGTPVMIAANTLYAHQLIPLQKLTLNTLSIYVTIAAVAGSARLGLYKDAGAKNPSGCALVADFGVVSVAALNVVTLAINQAITPDSEYWLALVSNGTPTLGKVAGPSNNSLGYNADWLDYLVGYSVEQAYGALPANFPAGAALVTFTTGIPVIMPKIGSIP